MDRTGLYCSKSFEEAPEDFVNFGGIHFGNAKALINLLVLPTQFNTDICVIMISSTIEI